MKPALTLFLLLVSAGCSQSSSPAPQEQAPAPAQQPRKPLALKTTDKIGEFQAGKSEAVTPDVEVSNPITGPLEAYEPMKQQIAQLGIERAVQMFQALEGRYPKDHAEFMQRVIKENHIRLPQLGHGFRYEYDVQNHKLQIVKDEAPE